MYCSKCGNEINEKSKFCPSCGTPIIQYEEQSINDQKDNIVEKHNVVDSSQSISQAATEKELPWWKKIFIYKNYCIIVAVLFVLAVVIARVGIAKKDSAKTDTVTELTEYINMPEDQLVSELKVDKNEFGMYPSMDECIFVCVDGKVMTMILTNNTVDKEKYTICGLQIGNNYNDKKAKLEEKLEFTNTSEVEGGSRDIYLEKDGSNVLNVDYDSSGAIIGLGYGLSDESLGITEEESSETSTETQTEAVTEEVTTEVVDDAARKEELQYVCLLDEMSNGPEYTYDIYDTDEYLEFIDSITDGIATATFHYSTIKEIQPGYIIIAYDEFVDIQIEPGGSVDMTTLGFRQGDLVWVMGEYSGSGAIAGCYMGLEQ